MPSPPRRESAGATRAAPGGAGQRAIPARSERTLRDRMAYETHWTAVSQCTLVEWTVSMLNTTKK
jgi:hypothetical protein